MNRILTRKDRGRQWGGEVVSGKENSPATPKSQMLFVIRLTGSY